LVRDYREARDIELKDLAAQARKLIDAVRPHLASTYEHVSSSGHESG
jgi:hypothetical protein